MPSRGEFLSAIVVEYEFGIAAVRGAQVYVVPTLVVLRPGRVEKFLEAVATALPFGAEPDR